MICERYQQLSVHERNVLMGKVQHVIQSDNNCFEFIEIMLGYAVKAGLFKGVSICGEIIEQPIKTLPELKELNPAHSGVLFTTIEKL